MSLAEELLADLEEGDAEEDDEVSDADPSDHKINNHEPMDTSDSTYQNLKNTNKLISVRQICHLYDSEQLKEIKRQMEERRGETKMSEMSGPVESDPEYQLLVGANSLAVEIDNEINTIHKFVRDKYNKRFPELESLVPNPLDYLKTVKELGNELEKAKNSPHLPTFLTQATIMVVSVTASTTHGQMLLGDELEHVWEACEIALELNEFKHKIYSYVESRMTYIAPNVSVIVGSACAAKLMGIAGGLTKLSKIPSCNVQVLGATKKVLSGFSQTASLPHAGFIYYSQLVQDAPPDLRSKVAKLVAAKCVLAARVDACHQSVDGGYGRRFREEIEKKIEKLQEPPPVKSTKALPKPVDPPKKRRGGKRVRKLKERFAVTELRKQQNRTTFGDIGEDAYQDDLGYNRGQLGKSGTGKVRMAQVDEKTKVRISKTLQKSLQKQQVFGGSTTIKKQISGTASSVAFTPLQGLEIVNPQAAEKRVNEANAKYFSNSGTFFNVNKN